jgi:uroporphyrinogen decarboxylase
MTGRERIARVLRFEIPDRTPIDLGGMRSTGIHAFALRELRKRLGLDPDAVKVYDVGQFLGWPDAALRERFRVDVVALEPPNRNADNADWRPWSPRRGLSFLVPADFRPVRDAGGWALRDARGRVASRMPRDGFYFDGVADPLASREVPSLADYAPAATYSDEFLDALAARADFLWRNTDCAILGSFFGGSMYNLNLGGMVNWMEMLVAEPDRARAYVEKTCDAMIARARLVHQAVGERVFALVIGDDMGTQRGEWYSTQTFRAVNAPGYKRFCRWVHAHTPFKVFLHCCGSVYNYMEDFIDCGIDIFNPVQTSAANMEPERLAREFGGRIVFWGGGCDTQRVLPFGTPEEVRAHVRERVALFRPTGGFVFNQVHNIQAGVPVDNIIAMLDAAHESGSG